MFRKTLLIILSALLIVPAGMPATLAQTTEQTKVEQYKKKVVEWGTNKNVKIKLQNKEKLKGRIAEIADESFTLQFVEQGKVTSRTIRYDELKSLSGNDGMGVGVGIALGTLAAVGVTLTIILVAIVASDD